MLAKNFAQIKQKLQEKKKFLSELSNIMSLGFSESAVNEQIKINLYFFNLFNKFD